MNDDLEAFKKGECQANTAKSMEWLLENIKTHGINCQPSSSLTDFNFTKSVDLILDLLFILTVVGKAILPYWSNTNHTTIL